MTSEQREIVVRPKNNFFRQVSSALLLDEWTSEEFSPVDITPPRFSYITWGMNNRLVGGCSSETYSHYIDMIIMSEIFSGFIYYQTLPIHDGAGVAQSV
jgi:hypothetical protein